ncbi:MAG TPA: lytic transglycosylase domain-containing protein [Chloroflexia bacterium]|nr:lytic transglycosylase domain-containing protein [Chloroflexia bacterium]
MNGRGNQPVKVAMMRQAQQGYGNRAVQRWLATRAQVQREPEAAPKAPAPQDTSQKKASTALTFDEVKQLITANNKSTVSTELLTCLIWKESGFNPNAKSKSSSATGLMQMTKGAVEQVNKSTPKGIHFEHSEMTDSARNIDCGSRYLQIRIDWAKGDLTAGLNGYGTGAGYADSILTCETCLTKAPADPTPCLTAIHP